MKNLKQFIFIALTLIALNSCKTPNEDKDDESQKSQSDQSIEEINHADILHNSSRLENDLFNKKLLQGGNLTLFSVIDAKPNTVFSFTFYGNIQPDNLGNNPSAPGFWYKTIILNNTTEIHVIEPKPVDQLPLVYNWSTNVAIVPANGKIEIKLLNVNSQVWPTVNTTSTFLKGSIATLNYIKNI